MTIRVTITADPMPDRAVEVIEMVSSHTWVPHRQRTIPVDPDHPLEVWVHSGNQFVIQEVEKS